MKETLSVLIGLARSVITRRKESAEPQALDASDLRYKPLRRVGSELIMSVETPARESTGHSIETFELVLSDAGQAQFENITSLTGLSKGDVVPEALGFLEWCADKAQNGYKIMSLHTDEGRIIAAVAPDGTYIKALFSFTCRQPLYAPMPA